MDRRPYFSVIIPAYERSTVIGRAIASVADQTERDFELIVVDDGSTDGTADVAESLGRDLFSSTAVAMQVIRAPHGGVSRARNRGADASAGEVLVFLDSDDEARPDWLADFRRLLSEGTAAIACCAVERRFGPLVREVLRPRGLGPAFGDVTGLFLAGSFAIRRSLWSQAGGYEPTLQTGENTEFALRAVGICSGHRAAIVHTDRPNLVWHGTGPQPRAPDALLESARYVLEHHGAALRRDPVMVADYMTVAGTNAIRLGQLVAGRKALRRALFRDPSWGRLIRAVLARLPGVAAQVWRPPVTRTVPPHPSPDHEVSVIIPCRDAASELPRQLHALEDQFDGTWEVIVVVNRSDDRTAAAARRFGDRLPVRVHQAGNGIGAGSSANVGAAVARGRKLMFINADDEVAPGYVRRMADALETNGLCAGRTEHDDLDGGCGSDTRTPALASRLGEGFLPYASGNTLGIQREVFDAVGGFDETFGSSGQDTDLCWRAQAMGYRLTFVPDAVLRSGCQSALLTLFRQARTQGVGDARLYATYRHVGLTRPRRYPGVPPSGGVTTSFAAARSREGVARALYLLGNRVGRLEGAFRTGTFSS